MLPFKTVIKKPVWRAIDTTIGFLVLYTPMATYSVATLTIFVTMAALVLNLPFGYLRMNTRKLSFMWFVYIHLPIPAIFILRKMAGLDYKFIPIIVAGAVAGQFLGGRLNKKASLHG